MECPKCHKIISDSETVCPHCHKVISLLCPNCRTLSKSSVCKKCGYIILEKCAKCGRFVPTTQKTCKCGLEVITSLAVNECETDEFASITVKFEALRAIRNLLTSQELYAKFLVRLRNLITAQLKNVEGNVIIYGNDYIINFNKELSFATSVDKALRMAVKILNAFTALNLKLQEELGTPLKINLIIQKKSADELLNNKSLENNVKLLMTQKNEKKYLHGMQIIMDQYSHDVINADYKTDSLYLLEQEGLSIMYYELLLDYYVLPPSLNDEKPVEIGRREKATDSKEKSDDIYRFKVFDINAKCKFELCYADSFSLKIKPENKIISIRGKKELQPKVSEIAEICKQNGMNPLYVSYTKDSVYRPWGFLEKLFKEYYNLPAVNGKIKNEFYPKQYSIIYDLLSGKPIKASSSEDARFAYMEAFINFLMSLKGYAIIVDGFENLDDTSIQALELYFDKFKKVNTNFIFITDSDTSVHSKIKGLLRTPLYIELSLIRNSMESLLSNVREDASDFINSFYYEKIKDNFDGSKLYYEHALKYLTNRDILTVHNDKLLIKNNNSVILPKNLQGLIKARLKTLGKNQDASMILAYSIFLGERLDFSTLNALGIKNIEENAKLLEESGFTYTNNNVIYVNNYSLFKDIFKSSLKPDVQEFLAKNIIAKLGKVVDNTTLLLLMDNIELFKEEYLLLWKNSQAAICTGDYDAYLKNCLGYLSLIDKIENNIPQEEIEANKKEVYQTILMSLYSYSPDKILSIENLLLMDEIASNNNDKIIKLSNLMLQGTLVSSDYKNALSALQNILERIPTPSLIVDGAINTKYLLLSLVNIEILYNIGEYKRCIEIGEEILNVITPNSIEKIKPANFSINLFVSHLMETFRLVGLAKLITMDKGLDKFFENVKTSVNEALPEQKCIVAIKEFLAGKDFAPSNIEEASPFSKAVYLILQELSDLKRDYKIFAQNIYQAKLLASDIHEKQLEYICDLLIAYAYAKIGIYQKANSIFYDVLEKSEKSAIFNIVYLANYLIAKTKIEAGDFEGALLIINDSLDDIQKHDNDAKIFWAMFEKLYIEILKQENNRRILSIEQKKLASVIPNGELERIVKKTELEVIEDEPAAIVDEPNAPGANENEVDLDSFVSEDMKTDAHP